VEKGTGGAKVVVVPPIFDSERAPGQRLEALEIRERERERERESEREREREREREMRTSPRWMRAHHVLPHATSRLQLSCHVWFGFSRHPYTVSVISPSSGIETRRIRMRWKGDDATIIMVFVPAP
jgi:hypothetical protein